MRLIKEIKSKEGELHFQRWSIFSSKKFSIYIHKIYKHDEDKFVHSHPWNLWTIILQGSYDEKLMLKEGKFKTVKRRFLHFAFRSREAFHKIEKVHEPVISLALVFGKRYSWGYWIKDHGIVSNEDYRKWKDYYNTL